MSSGVQCPATRPLPDVITQPHANGMPARFTTRCSNQSPCKWHACPLYVARGCLKKNLNQNLMTLFQGIFFCDRVYSFFFSFPTFLAKVLKIFPKKQTNPVRRSQVISQQTKLLTTKFDCAKKGGEGRAGKLVSRQAHDNSTGRMSWPAAFRDNGAEEGPGGRQGAGATRSRAPSPVPPHALRPNNQSPFHSAVQPFILPLTAPVPLLHSLMLCTFQCRHLSSQAQPVSPSPSHSPLWVGVHPVDLIMFPPSLWWWT